MQVHANRRTAERGSEVREGAVEAEEQVQAKAEERPLSVAAEPACCALPLLLLLLLSDANFFWQLK